MARTFRLIRPSARPEPASGADRDRAARFLEEWGTTPYARIARLPAYRYRFVAGGRCLVPYQVRGGMALALGGPVGPETLHPAAILEFEATCRARGWRAAFLPVPFDEPGTGRPYTAAGFRQFRIGSEAVLPLAGFDLRGGRRKTLRQSRTRARRRGYRTDLLEPPQASALLGDLCRVSQAWLAARRLPEARFGVGWFDYGALARDRLLVVRNVSGDPVAFANLVEGYSLREASLDLVRRDPACDSAVMDLLFVEAALRLREAGRERFNLGLAPLAGRPRTLPDRALRRLLRPLYDAAGLERFKAKFRPAWRPRYVAVRSRADLPRLAWALLR